MPYDPLPAALDDTFARQSHRMRRAVVVATNPFTVSFGDADDPVPMSRLAAYNPTAGDVVMVLLNGRGLSLVLGKVIDPLDNSGIVVPPPVGGVWSGNIIPNADMESGTTGWDTMPFIDNTFESIPAFLASGGGARAIRVHSGGAPYDDSDKPRLHLLPDFVPPCAVGATYRVTGTFRSNVGVVQGIIGLQAGSNQTTAAWGGFWGGGTGSSLGMGFALDPGEVKTVSQQLVADAAWIAPYIELWTYASEPATGPVNLDVDNLVIQRKLA